MTPTFGTLFRIAFVAQLPPQIGRLLPQIRRLLPGIEGFFEEAEGFFRRALGLNTHKFPKRGAASLTDLPELRLCLPSRVNNGKAEQQRKGFRKRASFLKTRTVTAHNMQYAYNLRSENESSVFVTMQWLWSEEDSHG